MCIEVSTTESFRQIIRAASVDALRESDFTAKALLEGLPGGQDMFYRVAFEDIATALRGEAQIGRFRTAPSDRRSVSFLWSGDTLGQGSGIDESRGGLLRSEPRRVPGLRAVLGVHVGPDPRRHRAGRNTRQDLRAARGVPEGMRRGPG